MRREEALADLQKKHGENLRVLRLDLVDTAGLRAAVDEAFGRWGRINVVVSNAAYGKATARPPMERLAMMP